MTEFIESADLWYSGLIAMIVLTLASGFFSGSETSFFYLSHDEIRTLRVGKRRERLVAVLLSNPDRLLTAILFWNLVINLLYFAVSIVITQRLTSNNLPIAAALFGLFSLFGLILFGEVLPKSVAVFARRKVATTASWPLAAAVRVLDPIIPSLSWVTRLVRRTLWPKVEKEPVIRPEDLERAVDAFQLSEEIIKIGTAGTATSLDLSGNQSRRDHASGQVVHTRL
ncbi:MAG: CNNM domain-containing protein [Planctomycetaceae bacterium]